MEVLIKSDPPKDSEKREYPISLQTEATGGKSDRPDYQVWNVVAQEVTSAPPIRVKPASRASVREFCGRIAELGAGVEAVLVEQAEGGETHITTFLSEPSGEVEERVYEVEAAIIQKYTSEVFDFHVRLVPRNNDGSANLPDGAYYLLTWRSS